MSRHSTIAAALTVSAQTWAGTAMPAALVKWDYSFELLKELVTDGQPEVIGIVPTNVDEQNTPQGSRGVDGDLITASVFVLVRLDDITRDTVVTFDDLTESLRDHLRTVSEITVGSETADRERTTLVTPFDHSLLTQHKLWGALIQCEYSLDVDAGGPPV